MAVAVSPLATPALDNQGSPVTLCGRVSGPNRQEFCYDGTFAGQNSTFSPYTVSAHSAYRFVISCPPRLDGCAPNSDLMGSIRVIPSGQGDAPVPLTVFTFKPGAFTVGEAGAPANRGAAFRMYVEASETPDIHTGIAVTNMSGTARNVILELFDLNGAAFMSRAINLGASSQFVNFLDDTALFPNMPKPFQGVLRISAPAEISVVGLRGRTNERNEFLITTTPPALESTPATSAEMLFPHLVNGGGYTTQFNLFSGTVGQTSSGTLRFYRPDGTPLSLNLP